MPGLARLGTPAQRLRSAVDKVGDLPQQAAELEGNGSNRLRQAESTAKLALA